MIASATLPTSMADDFLAGCHGLIDGQWRRDSHLALLSDHVLVAVTHPPKQCACLFLSEPECHFRLEVHPMVVTMRSSTSCDSPTSVDGIGHLGSEIAHLPRD